MMKELKVCFIGIGSIAKRHISNLMEICKDSEINLCIDAVRRLSNPSDEIQKHIDHIYTSFVELPSDYDIIFITNPTEYHADTLISVHDKAKHFFIEKPVTSLATIGKLENISFRDGSVYYVACPLRYTSVIQYFKEKLNVNSVRAVRCISSSFLPDWRPGTDYRDTYSAHKELGGGVSVDLIHEWDYISYLFGFPTDVKSLIGKVSNLEIDSDDYAIYIAGFGERMIGELHLDYFGRKPIRRIEIFTDDDTISGDLITGKVKYLNSGEEIDLSEDRNSYQKKELSHFLDMIINGNENTNEIANAIKVLKLTQGLL